MHTGAFGPSERSPLAELGRGGLRGRGDFSEFYADSGMSRAGQGRGGGLYGLSEPLLQYNNQRGHSQGYAHSNSLEPPYKRKFDLFHYIRSLLYYSRFFQKFHENFEK